MILRLVKGIVILPGTALVYVPGTILWLLADEPGAMAPAGPIHPRFWVGMALAVPGFILAVWTVRLFVTSGQGTPAPWDPPKRLVIRGPYRHVRNPMITSVLLMLGAESLLLGSWYLAGWMSVFFFLNTIYFRLVEEPRLEQRFGHSYRQYKVNVPRWIPRRRPYEGVRP